MTKVTVLGENKTKKESKPIEFIYILNSSSLIFDKTILDPSDFENIILICKSYTKESLDLMFAYEERIDEGILFLGHFNDGFVK